VGTQRLQIPIHIFSAMDHPVTIAANEKEVIQRCAAWLAIGEKRCEVVNLNEAIAKLRGVKLSEIEITDLAKHSPVV